MGQCFQDVGLAKQCPTIADHIMMNFDKCISDYFEAVTWFLNVSYQLICWLCAAKNPALMPMHDFMWHKVQLLSYLNSGYVHQMMEVLTVQ